MTTPSNDQATLDIRFWAKVVRRGPDDCWPWTGTVIKTYGSWLPHHTGSRIAPHRYAYERIVGPIPAGLVIDHLCRNRLCCNPAHMEPVTIGENVLRGIGPTADNARKARCARGHNDFHVNAKTGRRRCRTCDRNAHSTERVLAQRRRRRAERKAVAA